MIPSSNLTNIRLPTRNTYRAEARHIRQAELNVKDAMVIGRDFPVLASQSPSTREMGGKGPLTRTLAPPCTNFSLTGEERTIDVVVSP